MKSIEKNKYLKSGVIILIILMTSIFLEGVLFNLSYFKLGNDEKGKSRIELSDLALQDISRDGNEFTIIGDNPTFEIKGSNYIETLKITGAKENESFNIIVNDEKVKLKEAKKYNVNRDVKENTYINVGEYSNKVTFTISLEDEAKVIGIDEISIDNTYTFNYTRFSLILTSMLIVAFLIFMRDIARTKLHITFIVIIIGLGMNISLFTPTYFSYDEKQHFIKAYQTSYLDLGIRNGKEISWIDNINEFFEYEGTGSAFNSYKERVEYTKQFESNDYNTKAYYHTTASTYLFVPYVPAAIGLALGRVMGLSFINTFYLGRLFALATYAAICYFTIKKIKIAKRLVFMISLLPALVYISSSYSADSVTLACALATVGIFINMIAAKNNSISYKMPLLFAICSMITTMSKVSYAPLCILILAVPKRKFTKNINPLIIKLMVLILTGCAAASTFLFAMFKDINQWTMPGVSVKGQVIFILTNIFDYISIVLNSFMTSIYDYITGVSTFLAYSGGLQSIWAIIAIVGLFMVATIDNESDILELGVIDKTALSVSVILSWGLVVTALYLSFNPVGSGSIAGVQGRYMAPLLFPTLLLCKNNKIVSKFKKENLNYIVSIGYIFILVLTAIKLLVQFNY